MSPLSLALVALLSLTEARGTVSASLAKSSAVHYSNAPIRSNAAPAVAVSAASHSALKPQLYAGTSDQAVSNIKVPSDSPGSTDSDSIVRNKALKVSPQDKIYGTHQIDNDAKFHAPLAAPNDKKGAAGAAVVDEKAKDKPISGDSEKGSKGSVILDDYDPTRLGVSAGEAHNAKENSKEKEESGNRAVKEAAANTNSKDGFETGGSKKDPKQPSKEIVDPQKIADENRASSQKTGATTSPASSSTLTDAEKKKFEAAEAQNRLDNAKQYQIKDDARNAAVQGEVDLELGRFVGSALMIVVSEIGDKTFFIAALMAMRYKPLFVFSSSYSAMVLMTVMSMILGLVLPSLLSRKITTLLAALLFLVFGFRLLREAWYMDKNLAATEELDEAEQDLAMQESTVASEKAEAGGVSYENRYKGWRGIGIANLINLMFSPVWIQIFVMTFLGEWGDRSQIATVAMGAGEGWMQVLMGCLFGHFITTAMAVLGGKILANHLSLRTITFSGAACFLLFACFYFHDWRQQL